MFAMTLPPKNFHVLKRVSGSAGVVFFTVAGVLIRADPVSNKSKMFCVIVILSLMRLLFPVRFQSASLVLPVLVRLLFSLA